MSDHEKTNEPPRYRCPKCGDEMASSTIRRCLICGEIMCADCYGDHPHAYGIHIEGSQK